MRNTQRNAAPCHLDLLRFTSPAPSQSSSGESRSEEFLKTGPLCRSSDKKFSNLHYSSRSWVSTRPHTIAVGRHSRRGDSHHGRDEVFVATFDATWTFLRAEG